MATIRVCSWNIHRGLNSKESELKDIAKKESLDIISISEADVVEPPTIEGFKTISTLRSNPLQKVRLLALVRNNLFDQVKVRSD
jgi:hypothetical protein